MGLLDGLAFGAAAAADVGSAGLLDQFKALVQQDRETALEQVRAQMAQQTHEVNATSDAARAETLRKNRVSDIDQRAQGLIDAQQLKNVNATTIVQNPDGTDAPNDSFKNRGEVPDEIWNHPDSQVSRRDASIARLQAEAEHTGDYSKVATLEDNHEERMYHREVQAAKQKSDDEKWRASQEQAERFHKDTVRLQQQQIGLRGQDARDFSKAADDYIDMKTQYDAAVSGKDTPDIIASAKEDMDRAALKLKQFKVDVGDASSPFAKHMQLSSTANSLRQILADPMVPDERKRLAETALDSTLKQMAEVTSGVKGAGDAIGIDPPKRAVDMLLSGKGTDAQFDKTFGPGAAARARAGADSGGTPAANKPAATTAGIISEPVTPADYDNVEAARKARAAKAEADTAARLEAQRKRGEEIDRFNKSLKK